MQDGVCPQGHSIEQPPSLQPVWHPLGQRMSWLGAKDVIARSDDGDAAAHRVATELIRDEAEIVWGAAGTGQTGAGVKVAVGAIAQVGTALDLAGQLGNDDAGPTRTARTRLRAGVRIAVGAVTLVGPALDLADLGETEKSLF